VQATLATDIARRGSNFTIRKFTENPLTPVDLIEFGTIDPRTLAYLWFLVESQKSILVAGGTATGKTTMLNVITLFIRPEMKVVTIEDTPELRLPHDHWVPEVARESISSDEESGVDMYRLLKESLRQRPDYITVGEVRGREAFVLFQQMATGHPGFSTIHSENLDRLVDRLTTEPINLPPSLIENLDSIVFLKKTTKQGNTIRRVNEVLEMESYDRERDRPIVNQVFKWDPNSDKMEVGASSTLLKSIAEDRAMDQDEITEELKDRVKVIEWLVEKSVRNLDSINKAIEMYYTNKERLMERIELSGS
ncbi:MAG: type II/IV secretion system ATPase subunit, partial [Candidatus Aenigmatarchaeota archaeon]